jgi:hypothetical protein
MADIAMCRGYGFSDPEGVVPCPSRESCYRYTAPVNEFMQSYFADTAELYDHDTGDTACDMYWKTGNRDYIEEVSNA